MKSINYIDFYLMNVNTSAVKGLPQITSMDTFEGMTKNFHPEGLYSNTIFGMVGSEERDDKFAYIDIGIPIISPVVAIGLFELRKLYREICEGRRYATWDEKEKDFEPALPDTPGAKTGYSFFISHYDELKPKENDSKARDETLAFFNKHRGIALSRYVLTLPAGLRDLMITPEGGEKEEEIAKHYRKLIALSRSVPDRAGNNPLLDGVRWKLQAEFIEVFKHFFGFLDGKKGYSRAKVTSRKVMDGTRNVISPFAVGSVEIGAPDAIRPTDTRVGLYQGIKALMPVAQYHILNSYLPNLKAGDGKLYGVNVKTKKRELVKVDGLIYDKFTTDEGVEKLISGFTDHDKRHAPVMINDTHAVALIYSDDDTFKVFYDIDDLPNTLDKNNVRLLTLTELLYLSGHQIWNDYFMFVTRYPVTGEGSTYSSTIRLETTEESTVKYELGDDWSTRRQLPAICFPKATCKDFVTSMAPNPTRLNKMGGDYDGDMVSGNAVMAEESLEENRRILNSKNYWFTTDGDMKITLTNDVVDRTVFALLKEPK